jgi:hypothetical protein
VVSEKKKNALILILTEELERDKREIKKRQKELELDDSIDKEREILKVFERDLIESGASREEIQKKLSSTRIGLLQKEIDQRKELGQEVIDIELQLQREILKQREDAEKQAQIARDQAQADEDAAAAKRIENEKKITSTIIEAAKEVREERLKVIDDEIKDRQSQISSLEKLAAQGSESAIKNLEFETKKVAELERQQRLERERQQIFEASLSAFATYRSILQNDPTATPQKALAEAITSTAILKELVKSILVPFDVGTDSLGHSEDWDGKGGRPIMAHKGEMIIQKDLVDQMGNPSRFDVADVFTRYTRGELSPSVSVVQQGSEYSKEVVSEIKGMRLELRNAMTDYEAVIDKYTGFVTEVMEYKNKNRREVSTRRIRSWK